MNGDTKQLSNSQNELVHTAAAEPDLADDTIIAKDITISGRLHGTGNVLIEGTVIGGTKLDGVVNVARSGTVKGPIEANTVNVAGCVVGDVTAKACLRLEMTGSITGDVTMSSFTIEDGGYFNGQSHMTNSGTEPVILY